MKRWIFYGVIFLLMVGIGFVIEFRERDVNVEVPPTEVVQNPADAKRQREALLKLHSPDSGRSPDIVLQETWAQELSTQEVESINQFVGTEVNTIATALPAGGYKVEHAGKYRHGIVLQKQADGSLIRHEVGPNGIYEQQSSAAKK